MGIVFIQWIFPIIDGLVSWLMTYIEERKGRIALRITKIQAELEEGSCCEKSPAIGFQWVKDEEEEVEEQDD